LPCLGKIIGPKSLSKCKIALNDASFVLILSVFDVKNVINLRGNVEIVPVNSLPNDGKVIDDKRNFGD